MEEKEIKKRLEKINNISEQLLAALDIENETYISRRLKQLISLNGKFAHQRDYSIYFIRRHCLILM